MTSVLGCRHVVELVTEYLEGALPAERRRQIVEHLSGCSDCLRYVAQIQLTVRLLGQLTVPALSEDAVAELAAAFHSSAGQRRL